MSESNADSLHKEFELERMILFSDAVFAIAITLLIIEIKFPELPENFREHLDLVQLFRPTILQFIGFLFSFFIIGVNWMFHLNTFRHLKAYDTGLIGRNLLCLLFIVAFPFSAAGITHLRPSFMFPFIIYIGNVMLIALSNFLLTHYIFKTNLALTTQGDEAEKKYLYLVAKVQAIGTTFSFVALLSIAIVSHNNNEYITYGAVSLIPLGIAQKIIRRKYKPKK